MQALLEHGDAAILAEDVDCGPGGLCCLGGRDSLCKDCGVTVLQKGLHLPGARIVDRAVMAPGRVTLWPLMKWLIVRMKSFSSPLLVDVLRRWERSGDHRRGPQSDASAAAACAAHEEQPAADDNDNLPER